MEQQNQRIGHILAMDQPNIKKLVGAVEDIKTELKQHGLVVFKGVSLSSANMLELA